MRERIEDLGRLTVLLDNAADHEIFDTMENFCQRPKDFTWLFSECKDEEKKDELLHNLAYGLDSLRNAIYDMLSIAKGWDPLNDPRED